MTSIVDYINDVTLSYDGGWETRVYRSNGTFQLDNDWTERGYDGTLNEHIARSKGTASGRYSASGATVTHSSISSSGNWTLSVNGDVRSQSSVVFSSGDEVFSCSAGALNVESTGSYRVAYKRL